MGAKPKDGAPTYYLAKILQQNCMKMKEIGPRGGECPWIRQCFCSFCLFHGHVQCVRSFSATPPCCNGLHAPLTKNKSRASLPPCPTLVSHSSLVIEINTLDIWIVFSLLVQDKRKVYG